MEGRKEGASGRRKQPCSDLMPPPAPFFFLSGCWLDVLTDPQRRRRIDGHTAALLVRLFGATAGDTH